MKTIRQTTMLTLIFFIVLTLLTMKEEAPIDGLNTYGFPFTFYTYCARCDKEFNFIHFLADIGLLSMVTYFIIRYPSVQPHLVHKYNSQ